LEFQAFQDGHHCQSFTALLYHLHFSRRQYQGKVNMGLFTKVEDRPTPAAVYGWRVYTLAAIAGSAAIMIGYGIYSEHTPFALRLMLTY
jgi:hypothetical protein